MNFLGLVLALAAAFGQAQPTPNTYKIRGPEPVDVPAIQVKKYPYEKCFTDGKREYCIDGDGRGEVKWTCADKSRILLTDERGAKHCIKF